MNGKEIRLRQLYKTPERLFVLPLDHGITLGPVSGLKDIHDVVGKVSKTVDAVVVHKGLLQRITDFLNHQGCKLIVHLSASTALAPDSSKKELVTSVEHALSIGASAVSIHVNLGSPAENQMLLDLGKTAEVCDMWGIPLLAMMYVRDGSAKSEYDPEKVRHSARVAEELGADIVKVNYTGNIETFRDITESVKIPVIIAGGPKMASDSDLLSMISDAVVAGAKGVAIGRNVFQHETPDVLAGKIRCILEK